MFKPIQINNKLISLNTDLFPNKPLLFNGYERIYELKYVIYPNRKELNQDKNIKYKLFNDLYYGKDKLNEMYSFIDKLRKTYYFNVEFYLYSYLRQDIFISLYFMKKYSSKLNSLIDYEVNNLNLLEYHRFNIHPKYVICDVIDSLNNINYYSFSVIDEKNQIVYKSATIFGCLLYIYIIN